MIARQEPTGDDHGQESDTSGVTEGGRALDPKKTGGMAPERDEIVHRVGLQDVTRSVVGVDHRSSSP